MNDAVRERRAIISAIRVVERGLIKICQDVEIAIFSLHEVRTSVVVPAIIKRK